MDHQTASLLHLKQSNHQPNNSEFIMPKMKTVAGAKKRFKVTGSGQIKRQKANRSHILTSKNRKRKRNLRRDVLVDPTNLNIVLHCLGMR